MPKLKTKKSVAKRIKITKNGKALRYQAGKRHLLSGKKSKRKRMLRRAASVDKTEMKAIRLALPYA